MIKNFMKVALRNLIKHKSFSLINIASLTIGIASCILILLWIQDELSYDRFHEHADRIYRIATDEFIGGVSTKHPATPLNISEALDNDFPEIEKYVRLFKMWVGLNVESNNQKFFAKYFFYVDPSFFEVFTVPIIHGNPKTPLIDLNTCVLSKSAALKYFGNENAVGKILKIEGAVDWLVTAVAEDLPQNSHFHFDIIAPIPPPRRPPSWLFALCHTYIVLNENVSPDQVEAKFPGMVEKYFAPEMEEKWGMSYEEFTASGGYFKHSLQPLDKIHLHSNLDFELEKNGDIRYIYIFTAAGFFILLMACINYTNLATARSARRMKEIGVRKVIGSHKALIVRQFLSESVFLSFISGVTAVALTELVLPFYEHLSGKQLGLYYFSNPFVLPLLLLTIIFAGLLAGVYPAFFLAKFKPIVIFRGTVLKGVKKSALRNVFVTVQIAVSIVLITSTFVVSQQLKYIATRDLGFEEKNMLVVKNAKRGLRENWDAFKNDLLQHPDITHVEGTSSAIGDILSSEVFYPEGKTAQEGIYFWRMYTGYDLQETMQFEILKGRYFSKEFSTDSEAVVINETGAKELGWKDPIGKQISMVDSADYNIIGVVKDFHFHSLYKNIEPLAIILDNRRTFTFMMLARFSGENVQKTLAFVEEKWKSYTSGVPFEYSFLENKIKDIYRPEESTREILSLFSAIGILLACIGLLGLASFVAAQRTKEIGIRKVYGASVSNIMSLLLREFTWLLIIANVVAWPVAWFVMTKWLEIFAYRTDLEIWMFVISAILTGAITILTVSSQTIKASYANPVDSLKYE
jgi:putative ABC transport system permease protein